MRQPSRELVATPSQTAGPFFHFGPGADATLARIVTPETVGETIRFRVVVTDRDGTPVSDSFLEIWHADSSGRYLSHRIAPGTRHGAFPGFGRMVTDAEGVAVFETVRPAPVAGTPRPEAAHINICVFARGLLRHLLTRAYFAGDAAIDNDPVMSLVPAERRETLLAVPVKDAASTWLFDIRLRGDRETVFFDL